MIRTTLTGREAQILRVIWDGGEATVEQIVKALPGKISDSAVRTLLGIMVKRGYVKARKEKRAKIYESRISQSDMGQSALRGLIHTFFKGSPELLVAQMMKDEEISLDEIAKLQAGLETHQDS